MKYIVYKMWQKKIEKIWMVIYFDLKLTNKWTIWTWGVALKNSDQRKEKRIRWGTD